MSKKRGNREGCIIKLKDGSGYRGAVQLGRDENGKVIRRYVYRPTRSAAVEEIKKLVAKHGKGRVSTSKRTVEEFLREWLETHVRTTLEPLTYETYSYAVKVHLIPGLGAIRLDRLTTIDVSRCLNKAIERGLSPTTIKNIRNILKSALRTAIDKFKYLDKDAENVAEAATLPKQRKYKAKFLTPEQADLLLKTVEGDRYEAMFHLALMMGLRRGEVLGVQWSDIDFNKGVLHVRQSLKRIVKTGVVAGPLKTEQSQRVVPIPQMCIKAFRSRQIIQEQERLAAGELWVQDGDLVLTSRHGRRVLPEEPTHRLNAALAAAGLGHVRFHDLRHSTASLLIAKGVPMKVVQEIMGHSSYHITANLYTHLMPGAKTEAMAAMDQLFLKTSADGVADGVFDKKVTIQ